MAGKLSEELEKNTEVQRQLYREKYYQNHGEYPPEERGCLSVILKGAYYITIFPMIWCFKWIFKGCIWCGKWFFKAFIWCSKWFFKGCVWCGKWLFKGIIYGFKGMFYTFPRFLLRKGKIGKILFVTYIAIWVILVGVSYITQRIQEKNAVFAITEANELNVFMKPSSESLILEIIPKNTSVKILNETSDGKWAKIKYNNNTGFVNLEYLIKTTNEKDVLEENTE